MKKQQTDACPSTAVCWILLLMFTPGIALSEPHILTQVKEDFSVDPGWEGVNNRIVPVDAPNVVQDFGWDTTNFTGAGPGEIGGRVWASRNQAFYAMPLGVPLSFGDSFSASGKVALRNLGPRGVAYFGWFNSSRHEWRPWSSLAFRIWNEDGLGQVMVDLKTADYQATGFETPILLPPDGAIHSWQIDYDPNLRPAEVPLDPLLNQVLTELAGNTGIALDLQHEPALFIRARRIDPDLTAEAFHLRLRTAYENGLVQYFHRHGQHRWWKLSHLESAQGRVRLQFDDGEPFVVFLNKSLVSSPGTMDRFGLFNVQRYGLSCEVYFGALRLNGQDIELKQDPHWEGRNNRVSYVEPDFHSAHSYGFSQTNWAGESPGEIGGLIWTIEAEDPVRSFYAQDVGQLSLEDPITFAGNLRFVTGQTDSRLYFGYFSRETQLQPYTPDSEVAATSEQLLGLQLLDQSSVGWRIGPVISPRGGNASRLNEHILVPTEHIHRFSLSYRPLPDGSGEILFRIDGSSYRMLVSREQRATGASFDRFGLANICQGGGNSLQLFLDDISYTSSRSPNETSAFHRQSYVTLPYPHAGREY